MNKYIQMMLIALLMMSSLTATASKHALYAPRIKFTTANGTPLAGGKLYTYAAGTTTPLATYTDYAGGTPNANPVILDSAGEAAVWMSDALYKLVLKNSADVTQWTVDNYDTLNADAVTTVKIIDGAVTAGKLASDSVTTIKILDGNVTLAKLASGVIAEGNALMMSNLAIGTSVSSPNLTISVKQSDGTTTPTSTSPTKIAFRSATLTDGSYTVRTISSATTLTFGSNSSLGCISGSNCYIWVFACDNAGTVELGVNTFWLPDGKYDTFSVAGANTTADAPIQASARTGVQCRSIGRLKYATAQNHTYATTPDEVIIGGGAALKVQPGETGALSVVTSSVKTPGATAQFQQLTNGALVLQPGVYRLRTTAAFNNSGSSPAYTFILVGAYLSNGADSGTQPSLLTSGSATQVLSGGIVGGFGTGDYGSAGYGISSSLGAITGPIIDLKVFTTVTVYAVTYEQLTTAANARITAQLSAERLY